MLFGLRLGIQDPKKIVWKCISKKAVANALVLVTADMNKVPVNLKLQPQQTLVPLYLLDTPAVSNDSFFYVENWKKKKKE